MIFSLMVRNYKVYSGWNYIPLAGTENFGALVGDNGVGKSAVLESLDIFFNNYLSEWNYNHTVARGGIEETKPEICPFFIVSKDEVSKRGNLYKYLGIISDFCWSVEKSSINPSFSTLVSGLMTQRAFSLGLKDDYFLFPCGVRKNSKQASDVSYSMGFLDSVSALRDELCKVGSQDYDDVMVEISSFVRERVDYIYIPSEIDYEKFTKIEGGAIQSLMGSTIDDEVRQMVDPTVIKRINTSLDRFLSSVEGYLGKYVYKKPAKRQVVFNASHLTSKIIEVYFESKVLNLKSHRGLTPVSNFSSGEKRRALIDIAEAFILKARKPDNNKSVIFALDEPEISLHLSACFEQFAKLERISASGVQVLISTHWYGFFPVISNGVATYISGGPSEKECHQIRLPRYREDIRYIQARSGNSSSLNVELKSINDTVQSVISSVLSRRSKWIVCEGYSDKIYLCHYFPDAQVISMGTGEFVRKFYDYMYLALNDVRSEVKGKVFFILDTDKNFESREYKESVKSIRIRRFQNVADKRISTLKTVSDNLHYPPTEMEDVLDSAVFTATYESITAELDIPFRIPLSDSLLDGEIVPSGLAYDLKSSEKTELAQFFDQVGMKVKFASQYCKLDDKSHIPGWVSDVERFLKDGK